MVKRIKYCDVCGDQMDGKKNPLKDKGLLIKNGTDIYTFNICRKCCAEFLFKANRNNKYK